MSIDWSKPEKLQFRHWEGTKIIEILMPKTKEALSIPKPVIVFTQMRNGIITADYYSLNGRFFNNEIKTHRDILDSLFRPMTFKEISHLFVTYGMSILLRDNSEKPDELFRIIKIDTSIEAFYATEKNTWLEYYFFTTGTLEYSIDGGLTFQSFIVDETKP